MPTVSLLLPYVVEDGDRKKPFDQYMEVATILSLAEARRGKGGVLGGPPERVSLVSRLYYPIWAFPWGEGALLVDGLGLSSSTVLHMELPDLEGFTEDLQRGASDRQLHRDALKRHAQTFRDFAEASQVTLEAVIGDRKLLSAISEYAEQPVSQGEGVTGPSGLIQPRLDEGAAREKAEILIDHWGRIQSEVRGLQYAVKILGEVTSLHEGKILREAEQLSKGYEEEILRLRPSVEKRAGQLARERDSEIEKITRSTEKELQALSRRREKLEGEVKRLEGKLEDYRRRGEARRRRKDREGVSRWERRARGYRGDISEVEKGLSSLRRLIEQTRRDGEAKIEEVKRAYQGMVDQERKRISDVEAERDREAAAKRREIEELRSEAASITAQIERLIEKKAASARELEEMAVPWRPADPALICVPLYLVRYEADSRARNDVHPPAVAGGYQGIQRRIERALRSFSLEARIGLLLRPRSRDLGEMLTSAFAERVRRDEALEGALCELGRSNNLLDSPDLLEKLVRGMGELEAEGWISPEEKMRILGAYGWATPP